MSFLLLLRCLNIALALIAIGLNADRMIHYRLWRVIEIDALYRWLTLYGLLFAYVLATILALYGRVPVGPWTVVWTPPLIWAVISEFISRDSQPPQENVRR
jgi:hypothetical protein